MKFVDWIKQHRLKVKQLVKGKVYSVDNQKFVLIKPKKVKKWRNEQTLFDEDLCFLLTESDWEFVEAGCWILFKFGERYYYTPTKPDQTEIGATFNDFKWLGKAKLLDDRKFTHLGCHTQYELLNGSHDASDWVKKATFLQQTALGICDKDTLAGTLSFQVECEARGIKPILGMTATIGYKYDGVVERFTGKLYVKNVTGWRNFVENQ